MTWSPWWMTPIFLTLTGCCCCRWSKIGSLDRTIPSQTWRYWSCCCCNAANFPCLARDLFSATFWIKDSIFCDRTFSVEDRRSVLGLWTLLSWQFLSKYSTISLMSFSYLSPLLLSASSLLVTPMQEISSRRAEMSSRLSLNTELVLLRDNNADAALKSSWEKIKE